MKVLDLEEAGNEANEAVGEFGLVRTAAMLGEGFCPLCQKRGTKEPVFPDFTPDEEERPSEAVVNCATCMLLWRTGPNLENPTVPVWVEHTRSMNHMFMTMALNPPSDPPDDYEVWDEEG